MAQSLIHVTSLGDLLLRSADQWPDKEVLVFPHKRLTYSELANRSKYLARSLRGSGIRSGDHVGILAPNLIEVIELLFAIALCDAVAVLINARYKTSELAYVIENADLKLLFSANSIEDYVDFPELLYDSLHGLKDTVDTSLPLQLESAPLLEKIVLLENVEKPGLISFSTFESGANQISDHEMWQQRHQVKLSNSCMMMYTSGTTANPKGCRLSHEAIVRNALEISLRLRITETDIQWNPLPMFHMSAIMPLLATMWAGGSFISATHFVADEAMRVIEKEKPTILFTAFPAVMSAILDHPDFKAEKMSQVRLVNNVAPPNQLKKNMQLLPQAIHISAYGMTEAAGISCFGSVDESDEIRATTSGKPFPGVQMRVVDVESGKEVETNTRGEITIKGFSLFEGYYKSADLSSQAFDNDGWFHTGDLCSQNDEGHVSYHGRIKDMLKVGGENVAAIEIESFLCNHPAILISQVVSIPDEKLQEVAAAFIQLKPKMSCTEKEIVEFCTGKIASYKIPRYVRFVEEWPQSATKIQKHKLQQALIEELAQT